MKDSPLIRRELDQPFLFSKKIKFFPRLIDELKYLESPICSIQKIPHLFKIFVYLSSNNAAVSPSLA